MSTRLHSEVLTGEHNQRDLVLLPGLLGSVGYFRRLASQPALADTFRVIGIDLPGHGQSDPSVDGYGPEQQVDDVLHKLDELGLDKFTLAGHSLGGIMALGCAAEIPDKLESVVAIGSPYHATASEAKQTMIDVGRHMWYLSRPGGRRYYDFLFRRTPIAARIMQRREGISDEVANAVRIPTFDVFTAPVDVGQTAPGFAIRSLHTALRKGVDVTMAYGEDDRWVNRAARERLSELLANSNFSLHTTQGGHHLPHHNPEWVADVIAGNMEHYRTRSV